MTFQQLEYIVAVDKYRHFVNAATACGVTQSTLSSTIQKLEQEMDVLIFDRSKHPIEPTAVGRKILAQARLVLHNSADLLSLVDTEKNDATGTLRLGMLPSVAPSLLVPMARQIASEHPNLRIHMVERDATTLVRQLQLGDLDIAIVSSAAVRDTNLLEVELYTERFVAYVSPAHRLHQSQWVRPEDMQDGQFWSLTAFHDSYAGIAEVAHREAMHHVQLEEATLDTLTRMVDTMGGYTLLPELYGSTLSAERQKNVRQVISGKMFRAVSLVIRRDYVRERMVNIVASAVKHIVPEDMLNARLKKFDKITL